jgi:large repetitive protein
MSVKTGLTSLLLCLCLAPAGLGQQVIATGQAIQEPQVAVAGTGDYMIVWGGADNQAGAPSSAGVFARLFEASGKPKGPIFLVSGTRAGDQLLPQVAADERGNFVVAWQGGVYTGRNDPRPGGDGDGAGVFAQRFNRNGARLGSSFRLSRSVAGEQLTPNVAIGSDGSLLAVWQDCTGVQRRCSELHVGRFTAGGERQGEELEIPVLTATSYPDGRPVPNPTPSVFVEPGGFAVGWTEQEACYKFEFEKFPVVVHFTDAGRPLGERFRLDDGDCEDATGWSLVALTTSRTGSSAAFFNGERNSFQLFKPDGDSAGPRRVVGKRNPCAGNSCEFIGDASMGAAGDFAVIWLQYLTRTIPTPAKPYSLQAQFFDPQGNPRGSRVEVVASSLELFPPATAFAKDGGLLVVWTEHGVDGSSQRLLFRKIGRR